MSTDKKSTDKSPSVNLDLTGSTLRRREEQIGALDPYDSRRTFEATKSPTELFRQRREDETSRRRRREADRDEPAAQEKRIKFEIVDDQGPKGPKGGYNPYDAS